MDSIKSMDLNKLAAQVHENAVSKGFWEDNLSDNHYLMLAVCEMAEGVEADRSPHINTQVNFNDYKAIYLPMLIQSGSAHTEDILFFNWYSSNIKGTVNEELADTFIRLLDLAGARAVDVVFYTDCMSSFRNEIEQLSYCESTYRVCQILTSTVLPIGDIISISISMLYAIADNLGISLNSEVLLKIRYNSTRKRKHGKRY